MAHSNEQRVRFSVRLAAVGAVAFVAGVSCLGCQVALPDVAKSPVPLAKDSALKQQVDMCMESLNKTRGEISGAQSFQDTMTVTGGVVGVAGSITAIVIPAASGENMSDGTKTGSIVAASIAGVGSVVALLSKTSGSPTIPSQQHKLKEAHWKAASTVIAQTPALRKAEQPTDADGAKAYKYAAARLVDCSSSNPSSVVPKLPEAVEELRRGSGGHE